MWRNRFLVTASLLATAFFSHAQAPLKSVGVFSMLGDSVDVSISAEAPSDTRLERTDRVAMDFKGIGFDVIALRVTSTALRREHASTQVVMFKSQTVMNAAEQRSMAAGARNAELPAWMVRTIEDNRLTHVLLVTRSRGALQAETGDSIDIGRSSVEGIGFHMDTLYKMRNSTTGAVSSGLLAPHINISLMLMDTQSAAIVASYDIRESFAFAAPESQVAADPWSFMPNDMKVRTLREMVEKGLERGMTELLRQR
jgi:hypothetical protein